MQKLKRYVRRKPTIDNYIAMEEVRYFTIYELVYGIQINAIYFRILLSQDLTIRDTPPGRTTSYHRCILVSPRIKRRDNRCKAMFGLQPASGPWPLAMTEMWNEIITLNKRKRDTVETPANPESRKRVFKCEQKFI